MRFRLAREVFARIRCSEPLIRVLAAHSLLSSAAPVRAMRRAFGRFLVRASGLRTYPQAHFSCCQAFACGSRRMFWL